MPSINMIAPRRAEKRRLLINMQRLSLLILLELVILVGTGGWMGARVHSARVQTEQVNEQIKKLTPIVEDIKRCDAETAELTPKLDLLNEAKERTMRWYNTLDQLTQSLPQTTWLTRLSTKTDISSGITTLNLHGVSTTQAYVGEVMLRVQAISDLENVTLAFTQGTRIGEISATEFQIDAGIKGAEKEKEVAKNGPAQS